ncbi:MAG: M48 family metallopeptidase [Pigmentiphaga sp.]|uniref:M48 family metallopeptidase n=1 Tax=Pigmentiphaga sp. TaxID=1977564 RepID=UPI0029ACD923|nr:M48 family metallopeptidase [Pigmentiphaga sp.]MDX3904335.1 M48 family metallopeptidase [Pigmentiphaga sp.]
MFTLLFVFLLLAGVATRLWLATRQTRHIARHREQVPPEFTDRIGEASHRRAADYTVARIRLDMVALIFDTAVLVGLTLLGGLQALNELAAGLAGSDFTRQLLLVGMVAALLAVLDLPFTIWRQFVLEARFGFNRMTWRLFAADTAKGLALALLFGLPLLSALLWLMASAGPFWWVWGWALWVVFNLSVMLLFPTVIAPLFNKFTPLADQALADRIHALARRTGFALDGLFVMDGSKRSAHGNAYFTGLGKSKRIVFFDTLLARLAPEEIEAVLAHELGHFKHRHIAKRLAFGFGISLIFFALLGWLSQQVWFYTGLGTVPMLGGRNDALALVLFFLVAPVFTFAFIPLASWYSRKHEFEADRFASEQTNPANLVSALVKLYDDNAATLTPDPLHSAFYDSHPPASIRIGRLRPKVHAA